MFTDVNEKKSWLSIWIQATGLLDDRSKEICISFAIVYVTMYNHL